MFIRTLCFLIMIFAAQKLSAQTLIPYLKKNGKYIYVDSVTMKPVITREFADARFFDDGLAYAKTEEDGSFFIIDKTGNNAKAGKYNLSGKFDENGFANFMEGEYEGVVDRNGKVIVPAVYDQVSVFYDDKITRVKIGDQYGFVDRKGNLVISPQFDSFEYFSEGIAFVQEKGDGYTSFFSSNGKWGAINEEGNQVLPFVYEEGGAYKNGKAIVKKDGAYMIIDKKGNVVETPGNFKIIRNFANGFAHVSKNNKVGLLNEKWQVVVPAIYDTIEMMNINGTASVALNGKWGLVDTTGKLVAPCKYNNIEAFNGKALSAYSLNGKKGVISMQGKEITPPIYDEIAVSEGNFPYVKKGKLWGVLNSKGQVLIEPSVEEIDLLSISFLPAHGNTFMFNGAYRTLEGKVYKE